VARFKRNMPIAEPPPEHDSKTQFVTSTWQRWRNVPPSISASWINNNKMIMMIFIMIAIDRRDMDGRGGEKRAAADEEEKKGQQQRFDWTLCVKRAVWTHGRKRCQVC
jgi:hypothetical protein